MLTDGSRIVYEIYLLYSNRKKMILTNITIDAIESRFTFRTKPCAKMTFFTVWGTWFCALRDICNWTRATLKTHKLSGSLVLNKMYKRNTVHGIKTFKRHTKNLHFTQVCKSLIRKTRRIFNFREPFVVVNDKLSRVRTINWHGIRNGVLCVRCIMVTKDSIFHISCVWNVQEKPKVNGRKSIFVTLKI